MSSLTHIEKQRLERELRMEGGFVLDFGNRSFAEFFAEVVGVEIYADRFNLASGSKANRMRAFWNVATDEQLKALLLGLLEGWELYSNSPIQESSRKLLQQILNRLGVTQPEAKSQGQTDPSSRLNDSTAQELLKELITISAISPQRRGFAYEQFLKRMFDAYGLSARASFRLTGEQIDGSLVLHHETYLFEAKWENAPIGAADLHVFEGKLGEKAAWSRGLFVSNSGFSKEGLQAFGRGKRIVCMDGFDLSEMLRKAIPIDEVIAAKVRMAAETGNPYIPVRELFV